MDKLIHPPHVRYHNSQIYDLNKEEELRIYDIVDFVRVRLLKNDLKSDSQAEVFGRELPPNETVFFYSGQSISIYTWNGAKIEIEDPTKNIAEPIKSPFLPNMNPNIDLVNLNHILE